MRGECGKDGGRRAGRDGQKMRGLRRMRGYISSLCLVLLSGPAPSESFAGLSVGPFIVTCCPASLVLDKRHLRRAHEGRVAMLSAQLKLPIFFFGSWKVALQISA